MNTRDKKSENLEQAYTLLMEAVSQKCELVAFPENFSMLSEDKDLILKNAETLDGPTVKKIQSWAKKNSIWILAGSVNLKVKNEPTKVTNTSLLISPEGKITARYDKIHLFDATFSNNNYNESKNICPGTTPTVGLTSLGKVGLSICYDIRFPELYRFFSDEKANIIFIPSAFVEFTGKAHWDVLTRARAIENQAYVIAPNQTGSPYPGRKSFGHTRIIDPWGRVIAEKKEGAGVIRADLDIEDLEKIRNELPALKHRKIK